MISSISGYCCGLAIRADHGTCMHTVLLLCLYIYDNTITCRECEALRGFSLLDLMSSSACKPHHAAWSVLVLVCGVFADSECGICCLVYFLSWETVLLNIEWAYLKACRKAYQDRYTDHRKSYLMENFL